MRTVHGCTRVRPKANNQANLRDADARPRLFGCAPFSARGQFAHAEHLVALTLGNCALEADGVGVDDEYRDGMVRRTVEDLRAEAASCE